MPINTATTFCSIFAHPTSLEEENEEPQPFLQQASSPCPCLLCAPDPCCSSRCPHHWIFERLRRISCTHSLSLTQTSLNFRNWRMMFSSTVIHLNAGSTRFLSNSASLGKTVFATGHGRHPNQNLIHHPFYSCPTAIADACNICALSLLQILSTANFSYFRTSVKIIGNLSLDSFSRCHCTHELLRMK